MLDESLLKQGSCIGRCYHSKQRCFSSNTEGFGGNYEEADVSSNTEESGAVYLPRRFLVVELQDTAITQKNNVVFSNTEGIGTICIPTLLFHLAF